MLVCLTPENLISDRGSAQNLDYTDWHCCCMGRDLGPGINIDANKKSQLANTRFSRDLTCNDHLMSDRMIDPGAWFHLQLKTKKIYWIRPRTVGFDSPMGMHQCNPYWTTFWTTPNKNAVNERLSFHTPKPSIAYHLHLRFLTYDPIHSRADSHEADPDR